MRSLPQRRHRLTPRAEASRRAEEPDQAADPLVRRGCGRAAALLLLVLAGSSFGCAAVRRTGRFPGQATALFGTGIEERIALNVIAPLWDRYMAPYLARRLADFLDIFEVGFGLGWGGGVQASALVGFVGYVQGRYAWFGVFGADQVGAANDAHYETRGFPVSLLDSARVMFLGGLPLLVRAFAASYFVLGQEDGIGGPMGSSVGYGTLGFVGVSGRDWPMSSSGPVGAAVALGPVAVIARVRAGAVVNFVTGFLGFHVFGSPND